jgi:hypothetical protein
MGCARRFGCLIAVVVILGSLYLTEPWWAPLLRVGPARPIVGSGGTGGSAHPGASPWELVTEVSAQRGRDAIRRLGGASGAVFVNLTAVEFVGYVMDSLSHALPRSARATSAIVTGETLFVRMDVRPSEFGADQAPAAIRRLLGEYETLELGGRLYTVRRGLLAYQVTSLTIRGIAVPAPAIPAVVAHLADGPRPEGIGPDALALLVPVNVADVRVRGEHVTLYKSGP